MARKQPKRVLIPNAPVREAYLASDMGACEVCRRLGWKANDTSRLHRSLGMIPYQASMGNGRAICTRIDRAKAEAICKIIEVEFNDIYEGLVPPKRAAQRCKACRAPMSKRTPEGICGLCLEERELFGRVAVTA